MNCKAVQRHLLRAEEPARPPAAVAAHLTGCPACRAWHERLVRIERAVPRLPVPASSARVDLIRDVLYSPAFAPPVVPAANGHKHDVVHGWQRKERGLRKVAFAFALAAGLLLCAVGLVIWQVQQTRLTHTRARPVTLAEELARWEPRLANARTPRERVELLAGVTDKLRGEAKRLARAGSADELKGVAQLYDRAVREELLRQAEAVPAEERAGLLAPVVRQLTDAESEATRLASAEDTPEAAREHLRVVASAARDGRDQLRGLLKQGVS
ncbi:MAG TPA: hypothetical protein VFA26_00215 [Gemmataceae bacterium]|nr:hypothetical protein [Gemmataceae bacterium]